MSRGQDLIEKRIFIVTPGQHLIEKRLVVVTPGQDLIEKRVAIVTPGQDLIERGVSIVTLSHDFASLRLVIRVPGLCRISPGTFSEDRKDCIEKILCVLFFRLFFGGCFGYLFPFVFGFEVDREVVEYPFRFVVAFFGRASNRFVIESCEGVGIRFQHRNRIFDIFVKRIHSDIDASEVVKQF